MRFMKKIICCLLIGAICSLMLAAYGTEGGDSTVENPDSQNTEVNILKEIDAANGSEELVSKYNKLAYRSTYTMADDTISSAYCYMDADRYVYEEENYVCIDEDGDVYGFNDEEKKAYRFIFVDGSYEEYAKENTVLAGFVYLGDKEQVISQEEKDGVITVRTKIEEEEYVKEYAEAYLFAEGTVAAIESAYEVDAETYEMLSLELSAVLTDGTSNVFFEHVRVSNPETYVVDEQLVDLVNGEDKRTITVIAHPGTENEQTYTQAITKGNLVYVYLPADGKQVTYVDAACTTEYIGGADQNADMTVYYK